MDHVKVKLTAKELTELLRCYAFFIAAWESDNGHEDLLLEHAVILADRLDRIHRPEAKKYTVKLSAADSLAFVQWWDLIDDNLAGEYGQMIILRMIGDIDKNSKNAQRLLRA